MKHWYLVKPADMPAPGTDACVQVGQWHALDWGCHHVVVIVRGIAPDTWSEIGNPFDPGPLYHFCAACLGEHGISAGNTMLAAVNTLGALHAPFALD